MEVVAGHTPRLLIEIQAEVNHLVLVGGPALDPHTQNVKATMKNVNQVQQDDHRDLMIVNHGMLEPNDLTHHHLHHHQMIERLQYQIKHQIRDKMLIHC